MTNESHTEVQEFTAKQKYNAGNFLMFSALLPLITVLAKYNYDFISTLHISLSISTALFIAGYFFRAKAEKKLNKLYNRKEPKKISIYRQAKQNKKRSTAIRRKK